MRAPCGPGTLRIALACALLTHAAYAQEKATVTPVPEQRTPLRTVSREAYLTQLRQQRALLASCHADTKACDPQRAGDDLHVEAGAGSAAFDMRWSWLRAALHDAQDAKGPARDKLFSNAERRLDDDTADAGGSPRLEVSQSQTSQAQARTQAILAQRQFRHVEQTSWLQARLGDFYSLLSQLFGGFEHMLPSSSWIGEAVQWGILGIAAIALGFWAWTTTRQQRVAIASAQMAAPLWQAESERWAERAQAEADRGDWREAVHCLYWAAIVMLEGQKLWRQNRTRTPREYVRLLEPGSPRARLLGSLTRVFERIWYGLRTAERADYEQARGLLDQLRAA